MLLGAPALGSGDRAEVAVEPAEQQGDGPRVVHQAMAGTGQDAQLRRGVGRVGQLPGVGEGHHIVTGAVHYQQGPGRDVGDEQRRPDLLDIARPGARLRRVATGAGGVGGRSGLGRGTLGLTATFGEVGQWRKRGHAGNRRVLAGGAYRQGPAGGETYEPCPLDAGDGPQCAYGRAQVGLPPSQRELPVRQAGTPEVEGDDDGARLAQANAARAAADQSAGAAATTTVPAAGTTTVPASSSAEGTTAAVPGVSSAASAAVAAAEGRVGDPYVWGAAGPGAFDCSGLVMWAYAQAGVYLPHYSGAQYDDTIHIPMSDLEPGDLVFPADPGVHVAMYIGNGEIVQAPYTGANVQIVPLTGFFVLASRVG